MQLVISENVQFEILDKPDYIKQQFFLIIDEFKNAKHLEALKFKFVVGFPHIKYKEIDNYVLTFSITNNCIQIEYFIEKSELLSSYFLVFKLFSSKQNRNYWGFRTFIFPPHNTLFLSIVNSLFNLKIPLPCL